MLGDGIKLGWVDFGGSLVFLSHWGACSSKSGRSICWGWGGSTFCCSTSSGGHHLGSPLYKLLGRAKNEKKANVEKTPLPAINLFVSARTVLNRDGGFFSPILFFFFLVLWMLFTSPYPFFHYTVIKDRVQFVHIIVSMCRPVKITRNHEKSSEFDSTWVIEITTVAADQLTYFHVRWSIRYLF